MAIAILEAALRSAALVVVVWLLLCALRVRSPSVERTAWLAVLVASIAMPFAMNADILPSSVAPAVAWLPEAQIGAMTIASGSIDWQLAVASIYVGVAGALCVRQAIGLVRLWRVRSAAKPCITGDSTADIRTSRAVSSPATVFSTILVPEGFESWRAQERAAVLAHERAHVANGDFYVQALAHLHRSLFWFNPLAWWLPQRLSLLSEHMSDDAAIATLAERTAYAELLLSFARKAIGDENAIAMARTATLATRVERILDDSSTPSRAARWKHVAIAALLAPVVAISATLQTKQPAAVPFASEPTLEQGAGSALPPLTSKVRLPRSNPALPLSQPIYPPASKQLRETGTVVLKLLVMEDGTVGDAMIEKSSGYPNLDYSAMFESFRWKLDPGTVNDQPERMWGKFAVTFKLSK